MKKVILILMLCLGLSACSSKDTNTGMVGGAGSTWNYKEYATIEEMNEAAGTNLVTAAIAGKSDEKFGVISGNIAQYTFTANDEEWCLRASTIVDEDISGLYYESFEFIPDTSYSCYLDEVYAYRFFNNGVQYVISLDVKDKDVSTRHFDEVCGEFKTNITGVKSGYEMDIYEEGNDVVYLATMYQDDGSPMTIKTTYMFENDKMYKITSEVIFESNEKLNEYIDDLKEYDVSLDGYEIGETSFKQTTTEGLDFYDTYTKQSFIDMMKKSMDQ